MPVDRERVQRLADKLVRQNKLGAAIEQYKILLRDSPTDLVLINKIGDLLARTGRAEEAVRHFKKIAEVYTQGGFFLKAIAIYKKIIKLDTTATDSMLRLGDLYARQDLLKEAREMYLAATRQLSSRGEGVKARDVYEKMLKMDPSSAETRVVFAQFLENNGEKERAAVELATAATLLADQRRKPESVKLYEKALAFSKGNAAAAASLLRGVLRSSGATSAIVLGEQVRHQHPDSAEVQDVLVESYLATGREAEAEGFAKEAASRTDTPGPMTLLVLARLSAKSGRNDEAEKMAATALSQLEAADRAQDAAAALEDLAALLPASVPVASQRLDLAKASGDRATIVRALEQLGLTYQAAGMREEAAEALDRLAKLSPESPVLKSVPGGRTARHPGAPMHFPVSGKKERAREDDFVLEHLVEAEALTKYGLKDKAIEQLCAVVEKHPTHLDTRRRLKGLYLETGKSAQAALQCVALATGLALEGMYAEAVYELRAALELDPMNVEAGRMLASITPKEAASEEMEVALDEDEAIEPAVTAGGLPARGPLAASSEDISVVLDDSEGLFDSDIAEDLARAIGETLPVESSEEEEGQSFDEVFKAFQDTVRREVGEEDFGTHYELGKAYKEMGLLDEAISEFEQSSMAPERFLESCNMLALCFREKGEFGAAEEWYRKAIQSPPPPGADPALLAGFEVQRTGVAYDLGEFLAGQGDWKQAREVFEEVFRADRNYRDVQKRLQEARERATTAG